MTKTLLITGGSKGIGKATVTAFLAQGYRVVNISRSVSPLNNVQTIQADLSEPDWLSQCGDSIRSAIANSDQLCVVHCAALFENDSLESLPSENFHKVLQANVVAAQQLSQFVLPDMKAGSSIIYVSSTLGEKSVANTFSYSVSKHAVVGMMRATCQDLVGRDIHTSCICPGFTETEMIAELFENNAESKAKLTETVTFNRLIQPEEIARCMLFCAENPVLNGAVLHANLGQIER